MGRKRKYIILSSDEQSALELAYKTGKSHDFRVRCHCILLSAQHWSINQLAEFFQVGRLSISKWFKRYETEGIDGLRIRPGRGRKAKLDLHNEHHVKAVQVSLAKENRSIKQLREDLESQLGISLGDTTLRDFLKVLVTDTEDSDFVSNPVRTQGRWMKK